MTLKARVLAAGVAATITISTVIVSNFEGLSLSGYKDPVGIPTICYGHTATAKLGGSKSRAECEGLLAEDLKIALSDVESMVRVEMPVERKAAVVSFVYNVGGKKFSTSTMLRKMNDGDARGACAELDRWVYAGGKKLNGLVARRASERELCEVGL